MTRNKLFTLAAATVAAAAAIGPAHAGMLEIDFGTASFSSPTFVNNDYWPLSSTGTAVYFSESDDGCEVNRIVVSGAVRGGFAAPYDGISALVVNEDAWADEECSGDYVLIETTEDWHAQDDDGNVWYLGEATTAWDEEHDCLTDEGAWEAGQDGASAGVVVLGHPAVGVSYQQEYLEGEAEDRARVLRLDAPVSIGFGDYAGCMKTKDYTPLAPGEIEHKFYCRLSQGGVGLTLVNELKGRTRRVEYIGDALPDGDFPAVFPTSDVCAE